jgi:transcriptional regulator with XRE-family HTH domain
LTIIYFENQCFIMNNQTISWDDLKDEFFNDPEFKQEYNALESEYNLASQVIEIRAITGLTQRDFAQRIKMKQSQLARMESGKQLPKLETLARISAGAGYRIEVNFISLDPTQESQLKPLQIDVPDDVEIPINHHNKFEKIFNYLASDDPIAVDFRDNLGQGFLNNLEIRSYLEKCFELTQNKNIAQARKELEKCLFYQQVESQEMALTRNTSDTNSNNHLRLIRSLLKKFEELLEES